MKNRFENYLIIVGYMAWGVAMLCTLLCCSQVDEYMNHLNIDATFLTAFQTVKFCFGSKLLCLMWIIAFVILHMKCKPQKLRLFSQVFVTTGLAAMIFTFYGVSSPFFILCNSTV